MQSSPPFRLSVQYTLPRSYSCCARFPRGYCCCCCPRFLVVVKNLAETSSSSNHFETNHAEHAAFCWVGLRCGSTGWGWGWGWSRVGVGSASDTLLFSHLNQVARGHTVKRCWGPRRSEKKQKKQQDSAATTHYICLVWIGLL